MGISAAFLAVPPKAESGPGVAPSPPARNRHCQKKPNQGENQQGGSPRERCGVWGASVTLFVSPHQVPPLSLDSCDTEWGQLHSHVPGQFSLSVFCRDVRTSPATPFPGLNTLSAKSLVDFWAVRSTGILQGPRSCFPVFPQHRCSLSPAFPNLVEQSQTSGTVGSQGMPPLSSPSSTGKTRKSKKGDWERPAWKAGCEH